MGDLTEQEVRSRYITPAIQRKWDLHRQVREATAYSAALVAAVAS